MVYVSDLMTSPVITVEPATLVRDVTKLLQRERIQQVIVVDREVVVGIVTKRDVRAVRWAKDYDRLTAKTVMTRKPVAVSMSTAADRAIELLNAYRFDALPVIEDGVLVGIVTTSDVLDYFSSQGRRERAQLM